jgi:hypothetical protein
MNCRWSLESLGSQTLVLTQNRYRPRQQAAQWRAKMLALRMPLQTEIADWVRHLELPDRVASWAGSVRDLTPMSCPSCGVGKRPLPAINSLLAATASAHDLTLLSHNVKDFGGTA